jgi:hypothetical protein
VVAAEVHDCDYPEVELADVGRVWRCRVCGFRWELQGGTIFAWRDGHPNPEEREWFRWDRVT